jgi:hypothetical protein
VKTVCWMACYPPMTSFLYQKMEADGGRRPASGGRCGMINNTLSGSWGHGWTDRSGPRNRESIGLFAVTIKEEKEGSGGVFRGLSHAVVVWSSQIRKLQGPLSSPVLLMIIRNSCNPLLSTVFEIRQLHVSPLVCSDPSPF